MPTDEHILPEEEAETPRSNGQQQLAGEDEYDNKRRYSDGSSRRDSRTERASRKRQRIHDSDGDDDVILLDHPPTVPAPSLPSVPATQQRKGLTVTHPSQLPSSSPHSPSTPNSDVELDDDVPLLLRPVTTIRSSIDKQPAAAAAAAASPTPAASSTSVKSPFTTSTSGRRRLSKSGVKAATPATPATPVTSAPVMSPTLPAKSSLAASMRPPAATAAVLNSPTTTTPTTPPGASPTSGTAGRSVSSHMNERLVEMIGASNGGTAFVESVSAFIVSHKLSVRETRDLYFRLVSNLRSNTQLLTRVRSGDITAEQLCTMSEADMAGDEVRRQREEAKKASIRDVTMAKEMMIAKQTKAGVEYIAVAGDKADEDGHVRREANTDRHRRQRGGRGGVRRRMESSRSRRSSTVTATALVQTERAVALTTSFSRLRRSSGGSRESNGVEYESKYASDAEGGRRSGAAARCSH